MIVFGTRVARWHVVFIKPIHICGYTVYKYVFFNAKIWMSSPIQMAAQMCLSLYHSQRLLAHAGAP